MPIMICSKCQKPVPDSFHEFSEICSCKTKEEWIEFSKRKKYCLQLDGKFYNFRENTVVDSAGNFVDWKKQIKQMETSFDDAMARGEFK